MYWWFVLICIRWKHISHAQMTFVRFQFDDQIVILYHFKVIWLREKSNIYKHITLIHTSFFSVQYLIKHGVVSIVGPMTSTGVKFTQPYCAGFNIPQLAPVATDPTFSFTPANFPFLARLSPSDKIQCQALAGLISQYNWTQFALLTSKDDYGLRSVFEAFRLFVLLFLLSSSSLLSPSFQKAHHALFCKYRLIYEVLSVQCYFVVFRYKWSLVIKRHC